MAKSKGPFLLKMKIPIPGVAGWMLFILGSSSVDASGPVHFFLRLGLLCGGGGGLWFIHFDATEKDLGYFGIWDCSPFLYRHTNVDELDYGIAVHGIDKKTQCKSEAREATKKREGLCSTSMLNSESGCVQPTAPLHCNLTPGSVQPTAPLLFTLPVS